jgi:putative aldouronate transport system substrate-binding protein
VAAGAPPTATAATGAAARGTVVASPEAAVEGKIPSPAPGVPDAFTKLPPPFKAVSAAPGRGSKVTTFQLSFFPPVPPRDRNRYWQELEKRLAVTLEPTFIPQGEYPAKLSTVTASGDLPDIVHLALDSSPDQYRVIQQGGYTDLTAYVTGDALKEFPNLALFDPQIWKNIAINKKIYGVPWPRIFVNGQLMFRQDWAEKVGFARIASAADFFNCMVAFTKNDPDGNGAADTFGFGAGLNPGFVQNMFRVPNNWRRNPDGSLTKELETEEYKAAIAFARRLYEAGAFYPDAATLTGNQAKDGFISGKFGAYGDGSLALLGTTQTRYKVTEVNRNAKVIGLVPPGHDGGRSFVNKGGGNAGFRAISGRSGRDRERVKELLRVLDYFAAPFGSEEWRFINNGTEGVHYTLKPDGTIERNELGRNEIGDIPNLMYASQVFYSDIPGEAQDVQQLQKNLLELAVDDPALGLYSPTAVTKRGELNQLVSDRVTAVITGREPASALDEMVKDWRGRGGDQIRQELQDELKQQ